MPLLRHRRRADSGALFAQMVRMRAFEEASARLWRRGLISGEMHLGVGEEAILAGVLAHVREGDGLSVDHRSGPPFVARGVDASSLMLEMLGHPDGLCGGRGGHMHFLAPEQLAAGNGIVGASAPIACGFALAAQRLDPGAVGVAVFGDGAANQGMLLEALNLAAAWRLPVVFVCKENRWAITTRTRQVTGGDLLKRARGCGLPAARANGMRAEAVWSLAGEAFRRARRGAGPSFILARCRRPAGHFLGDPLIRIVEHPRAEAARMGPDIAAGVRASPGAPWRERTGALGRVAGLAALTAAERWVLTRDPLELMRRRLPHGSAAPIERRARSEIEAAVAAALRRAGVADA